jgi:hypothetical protein
MQKPRPSGRGKSPNKANEDRRADTSDFHAGPSDLRLEYSHHDLTVVAIT